MAERRYILFGEFFDNIIEYPGETIFETLEEANDEAMSLWQSEKLAIEYDYYGRTNRKVKPLAVGYVEKTEKYFDISDLADENFSWGWYQNLDMEPLSFNSENFDLVESITEDLGYDDETGYAVDPPRNTYSFDEVDIEVACAIAWYRDNIDKNLKVFQTVESVPLRSIHVPMVVFQEWNRHKNADLQSEYPLIDINEIKALLADESISSYRIGQELDRSPSLFRLYRMGEADIMNMGLELALDLQILANEMKTEGKS